ncbi:class I SAM-dependent methyltransferase [Crocosphaera sp. XPORK-15E]|uniref:class I SAM-dependent methyltransferase n=1 Tax=Crocosphaera sp. XPORK-15E TaxID=3110247 RepID=UPI002B213F09|nr:class I SAM-dependent methyltransferase [Crocosphaera sp. XPORK-15E]MEA5536126.1 class I SAM-dependent methyltransferase [Crocosphaera sp. XPORK-15E]
MKVCNSCNEKFISSEWKCPSCNYLPKVIDNHLAFAPELAQASDGFEAGLFSQLAPLEAKNFWFRSRNHLIIWALKRYFLKATKFLEIGCGTGFVLQGIERAFPKLTLFGSEIFTAGLSFASQRLLRTELFQMDARKIPFENEFDVIGLFDVLEHIEEDREVLAEIYRATAKGGGIILTVPQHPWLWSQADDYAHHVRRYRAQELKIKVEGAGFKVVKITSFVSLLLPLMLVSRLSQKRPNQNYSIMSELKISGWLNTTLENVLNLERIMIKFGISFPAGGSLLLVARKL